MFKAMMVAMLAGLVVMPASAQNDVTQTYNVDMVGIVERLNAVVVEVNRAQSCNVAGITDADTTRWNGYIDALRGHLAWVQTRPAMDLPEFHPHLMDLSAFPAVQPTNNPECNDIVRYLMVARDELTASQSTNFASNISDEDGARYTAVLDQITALIIAAPLTDLPESLSSQPSVLPGNRGPATSSP